MRRKLVLVSAILLVPVMASLGTRDLGSFGAPALACTGGPMFDRDAIVILPDEGATVPRNTRVLFFASGATSMFATRPTDPAELRTDGSAVPIVGRSANELRPTRLEANARYELWLPSALPVLPGKPAPPLEKARTFLTSDEDDRTAPRIRSVGQPIFHPPGPTSCGPSSRIELPIELEDASPAFVEVTALGAGATARSQRARVTKGRIIVWDGGLYTPSGEVAHATYLALTPVDIAGNRGEAREVSLHRLTDGGPIPAAVLENLEAFQPASTEPPHFRGCGKY